MAIYLVESGHEKAFLGHFKSHYDQAETYIKFRFDCDADDPDLETLLGKAEEFQGAKVEETDGKVSLIYTPNPLGEYQAELEEAQRFLDNCFYWLKLTSIPHECILLSGDSVC